MVELKKATDRNTPVHWVSVYDVEILFSYETAVAFRYYGKRLRIKNHWGPKTGRHMKEAYVNGYDIVDDDTFKKELAYAVWDAATKNAPREAYVETNV